MAQSPTPFNATNLSRALERFPETNTYWVGFSGGADSSALLHALNELQPQLKAEIKALHINHGLEPGCNSWQSHCIEVCRQLGVKIQTRQVNVGRHTGTGREAEARRLRYQAAEDILARNEIFLTAHHNEDQAETLLLNLMRGSGVDGLAGMPPVRALGAGLLARPLLNFSMTSLRQYLQDRQLTWIEDPSNQDLDYDRNFVRHSLLPLLSDRWPGVSRRIAKSASLSRIASENLSTWAKEQLSIHLVHPKVLNLSRLDPSSTGFALIVRQWLRDNQAPALPAKQMSELATQSSNITPGSRLKISWHGWTIHGFDDKLWLQEDQSPTGFDPISWSPAGTLDLGHGIGTLSLHPQPAEWPANWIVSSRKGGERLLSVGGEQHKELKDILRELGIPPWMRESVPLLSDSDELLAVGDFVVSHKLRSWLMKHSTTLKWQPGTPLLRFVHQRCHSSAVDPA